MSETRLISLTKGMFATVDASDYDRLMQYKWFYSERGYALRHREGKASGIGMHRMLLDPPKGMMADHINGDRLDNRRCNLRIASALQNAQNRGNNKNSVSKYKGVAWKVENNKWQARIRINKRQHHIGLFDTEEDAAYAYNKAAKVQHGAYARLNILPQGYTSPADDGVCPLCHQQPKPVSVFLEKCAAALKTKWIGTHDVGMNPGIAWLELAKAVLDAAGVKYE